MPTDAGRHARVVQNQEAYRERYNALVSRYDAARSKLDEVNGQIAEKSAKRTRLTEFIKELQAQDGIITEFDEALWGSLVDFVTLGRGKEMVFTFRDGTEITV